MTQIYEVKWHMVLDHVPLPFIHYIIHNMDRRTCSVFTTAGSRPLPLCMVQNRLALTFHISLALNWAIVKSVANAGQNRAKRAY